MASRRKPKTPAAIDASGATTATVTAATLPDGVPTEADGSVSDDGVDLDADEVRAIGAIDGDSARLNKTHAETTVRKRGGEKHVRWNDTNGLVKYDGIMGLWNPAGMMAYITRIEPSPQVNYQPVPCSAIRNGTQLYDYIMRNHHRVGPEAVYYVRVREGTIERGSFNLNFPDTTPQQQPAAMMQPMMPPWMMPAMMPQAPYGYPPAFQPPGPGYPPGYPPPPYQDPYGNQPPPQAAPPPPAAPAAPAPAPAPAQAAQPQMPMQPFAQPPQYPQQSQPPYYQPIMVPQAPPPPPTSDPAAQAWMGAMHQMLQHMQQTVAEKLDQRGEMEAIMRRIEELGRQQHPAPAPMMMQPPPPSMPQSGLTPAAIPPPGFGAPGGPMASPFGGMMPNPYAALGALPRPPGYPDHLQWPPNPWATPWGVQAPQQAAPAPAPPPPPEPPADPLDSIRRSVEMVGTLATLVDRARGVVPAVSESTVAAASPTPARPPAVETVRVGEVDIAMNPETGDVNWLHTSLGLAPKVFGFLEKITGEAAKTARSHDVAQAVQSGRLPMQYMPMQQQQPPAQYPPGFGPPQPQYQPPLPQYQQPPPAFVPPPAPVQRVVQPPPQPAPQPAAPPPPPAPAAAPQTVGGAIDERLNGFAAAHEEVEVDEGIQSLFS